MHVGYLRPAGETDSVVSLKPTDLICISCGKHCHELLVVPKKAIGKDENGNYRVVRCLNCVFFGPYYVAFENERPIKIVAPKKYECHSFIEDQCISSSVASITWIDQIVSRDLGYTPTLAGIVPVWVQRAERPSCYICRRPMPFVLQLSSDSLDTILRNKTLSDTFAIEIEFYATLYLFHCDRCNVTCSITQCD